LEKREKDGDSCIGLNLTFRSLAAVLKYDKEIPVLQNEETGIGKTQPAELVKGYYASENDLIKKVKTAIRREESHEKFKTIECDIMDIADDIAYSTYDLEDALKAGFVTPLDILRHAYDEKFLVKFAEKVSKKGEFSIDSKEIQSQ
jgi:dGTPase